MRFTGLVALALLLCPIAFSQTSDSNRSGISPSVNTPPPAPQVQPPAAQAQQPPSYANYSIMLVGPPGGIAVVLMHNPKNELEFVEVNNTKQALSAGYVPVRAAELGEFISALKEENSRLAAENTRLQQSEQAKEVTAAPTSSTPSQAELEAQRPAKIEAQKAARRRQMIQTWMMLQNMNRSQTQNLNITVSDCTRSPALCAGR
jgi:hypothetical protein